MIVRGPDDFALKYSIISKENQIFITSTNRKVKIIRNTTFTLKNMENKKNPILIKVILKI